MSVRPTRLRREVGTFGAVMMGLGSIVGTGVFVSLGIGVVLLTLLGDVRPTWSFSAFTVLVYYALTNLSALRLPSALRRFPRWVSWVGLAGCLGLAAFVAWRVLLAGLLALALGFALRAILRALGATTPTPPQR